jgi:hypothetical protein
MAAMSECCDFCGRDALEEVYEPAASAQSKSVFLCTHCALAQSLPRHGASAGPGQSAWPHARFGKSFRAGAALARLAPHLNWNAPLAVLDLGAERGAFLDALLERAPKAAITAIEPDAALAQAYRNRPRVTLVSEHIERVKLPSGQFDLIHACQTLQRAPSAHAALAEHHRALTLHGLLFVEVPNLELIGTCDIVEEWFVDRNLYHYTPNVLLAELKALGFAIVAAPDPRDLRRATVIARKEGVPASSVRSYPREVEAVQDLIASYKATRRRMRAALKRAVAEIERFRPRGVALWGAGRLLDALVTDGGFDVRQAAAVVDTDLAHAGLKIGDAPIQDPGVLADLKPRVVVVLSPHFPEEIRDEAERLVPGCTVVGCADLMSAAASEARP